MKCIVCEKELVGRQRKYCCAKCRTLGQQLGYSEEYKDNSKSVEVLYRRFKKSFKIEKERYNPKIAFKIRVFVCACMKLGWSITSVSRGIKKDHATILYHLRRIKENESRLADEFLSNDKYSYNERKNYYPEGFTYGEKK